MAPLSLRSELARLILPRTRVFAPGKKLEQLMRDVDRRHAELVTYLGGMSDALIRVVGSGVVGETGPAGPAGPEGPQGEQGPAGEDGADGADAVEPFRAREELASAATSITLSGLDGDTHKRYRVRLGGTINASAPVLTLRWGGEPTTAYAARRTNLFTGGGTNENTWKLASNSFGGVAQFSGHGELVADRSLIHAPTISMRTTAAEQAVASGDPVGSQTLDGWLTASAPGNLEDLILYGGGASLGAGGYLEVEQILEAT